MFHKVCFIGHLGLLKFLHRMAGPEYLDILDILINDLDRDELPPIYYLCERGYDEEIKEEEDKRNPEILEVINKRRQQALEILCPRDKLNEKYSCDWSFITKQTKNSLFHWLAYWNDYHSMSYLIDVAGQQKIAGKSDKVFTTLMSQNFENLSPMDVCGVHGCDKAAQSIFDYIRVHKETFKTQFNSEGEAKATNKNQVQINDKSNLDGNIVTEDGPFTVRFARYKFLTPFQLQFCSVFYWAAFFGDKDMVFMFLKELGVSPFIKLYLKRSAVMACINGLARYEDNEASKEQVHNLFQTFKLMVVNSHPHLPNSKYVIPDPKIEQKFLKTFKNRDQYGNNICHYLFDISCPKIRNECLHLVLNN